MLDPIIITSREMLRNQKGIFEKIKLTKRPAIIVSQKQQQVAIISLDDLVRLKHLKDLKYTKALLDLAREGELDKYKAVTGPKNLSRNLDKYLWE